MKVIQRVQNELNRVTTEDSAGFPDWVRRDNKEKCTICFGQFHAVL